MYVVSRNGETVSACDTAERARARARRTSLLSFPEDVVAVKHPDGRVIQRLRGAKELTTPVTQDARPGMSRARMGVLPEFVSIGSYARDLATAITAQHTSDRYMTRTEKPALSHDTSTPQERLRLGQSWSRSGTVGASRTSASFKEHSQRATLRGSVGNSSTMRGIMRTSSTRTSQPPASGTPPFLTTEELMRERLDRRTEAHPRGNRNVALHRHSRNQNPWPLAASAHRTGGYESPD